MSNEPNYELLFRNAVTAYQEAYYKLRELRIKEINNYSISPEGVLLTKAGARELTDEIAEASRVVIRAKKEVDELKKKMGKDK